MNYEDKVALITGGSGGFGTAFGKAFLGKGAKVCFADLEEGKEFEELEKTYGRDKVLFCKCDVTKDKDFLKTFEKCEDKLGTVNILINNAGIFNEKNYQLTLDVNVRGVIKGCEAAFKKMGKHNGGNGGHVINIASVAAIIPFRTAPYYAASKGAVLQYSRSLGDELHYSYSGVSVQCLCPSLSNTPMFKSNPAREEEGDKNCFNEITKQAWKEQSAHIPLIEPEEIADALLKLLEEGKRAGVLVKEHNKEAYYADLKCRI